MSEKVDEAELDKLVREQLELLKLENEDERRNNVDDLKQGGSLNDLVLKDLHEFDIDRIEVEFGKEEDAKLKHMLSIGSNVICCSKGENGEWAENGVVSNIEPNRIFVLIRQNCASQIQAIKEKFTVKTFHNDFTFRCMKRALEDIKKHKSLDVIRILFGSDENVTRALLTAEQSISELSFLNRAAGEEELDFENELLADDQKQAVRFAMKREHFGIIQGPPGTGKTTTLVELICQLCKFNKQVLVCAPTNVAVDNLALKLGETEWTPLRIGHPLRISPQVRKYSFGEVLNRDPEYQDLLSILRRIKRLRRDKDYYELSQLLGEFMARKAAVKTRIMKDHRVILSTLNSSGMDEGAFQYIETNKFDVVIIDEASQALEASAWIAIPHANKLIMGGDVKQLPPMVASYEAASRGLGISLMERAMTKFGETCYVSLLRQYRMNWKIMAWSNKHFYNNQLIADDSVKDHLLKDIHGVLDTPFTSESLLFVDTTNCNCDELTYSANTISKGNIGEAIVVSNIVAKLVHSGLPQKDIGVITPYQLQMQYIEELLNYSNMGNVEVSTVDGFQGREKEAIVMSFVRSNKKMELGFVKDEKRLNVAVTRAKRFLALVANSKTMSKYELITDLINHAKKNGVTQTATTYLTDVGGTKRSLLKNIKVKTKLAKEETKEAPEPESLEKPKEALTWKKSNIEDVPPVNFMDKIKSVNPYERLEIEDCWEDALDALEDEIDTATHVEAEEEKFTEPVPSIEKINEEKTKKDEKLMKDLVKIDSLCAFSNCKTSVKMIFSTCEFCNKRYCLTHAMQEVHGCGDEIRRKERKEFKRAEKPKPADRNKLKKKIKDMSDSRKAKRK